jgi:hypothetical protein
MVAESSFRVGFAERCEKHTAARKVSASLGTAIDPKPIDPLVLHSISKAGLSRRSPCVEGHLQGPAEASMTV